MSYPAFWRHLRTERRTEGVPGVRPPATRRAVRPDCAHSRREQHCIAEARIRTVGRSCRARPSRFVAPQRAPVGRSLPLAHLGASIVRSSISLRSDASLAYRTGRCAAAGHPLTRDIRARTPTGTWFGCRARRIRASCGIGAMTCRVGRREGRACGNDLPANSRSRFRWRER